MHVALLRLAGESVAELRGIHGDGVAISQTCNPLDTLQVWSTMYSLER
jgi:hypothetical protein